MTETTQKDRRPAPLDIAIVGAGIAGLAAAIALKDHSGVRVQLYERASALREIGASIALGPNGMRTLDRLGVHNALDDDVAFRNRSGYPMVYRHYHTNEIVSVDPSQDDGGGGGGGGDDGHHRIAYRHRTARFYRAHLQAALLAHIDRTTQPLHLNKGFRSVAWDAGLGKLVLTFADGSETATATATADLLLGTDGIQSAVRTFFVPASRPRWTGGVAFRSVFPAAHVAHIAGLPDEATHVWGPDRSLFFSPLGRGLFTVVGMQQVDPDDPDAPLRDAAWDDEGSVAQLRQMYSNRNSRGSESESKRESESESGTETGWSPLVQSLVAAVPHTRLFPNAAVSASLSTWVLGDGDVYGRVTLAGDAAHAHGGAFATGGSLALDDAWAFAAAVRHVFPVGGPPAAPAAVSEKLRAALTLYEATRKAHTDRLLGIVHAGAQARLAQLRAEARAARPPETDDELRQRIKSRPDPTWLHEHDVVAAFAAAVRAQDEAAAKPNGAPNRRADASKI
ncbi:salicylate 1-monooxygenase [Niveomyces insectorum RCEF 264]|uniref:Salicylate 1-monooxygenase n=1 Tax=Niveomyces insectorum RCEF 264 TaxID=1081102 RepID=A0A167XQD5_9HYPO|nr:salicylate 1-monooxygenase [Niveomyces insectorum RCEF 264]